MKYLLFLILIWCSGCSLLAKSKYDEMSLPLVSAVEKKCLQQSISTQGKNISTYRALIEATISVGRERYNLRQIAIFEKPDNSRIEILQPGLNQTASIIVTRNGELIAYSALKKVGYRGQANIENYYRLLGLPMSTEELMMWLAGVILTSGELDFYQDLQKGKYIAINRDGKREIHTEFEIVKGDICNNPDFRVRAVEIAYEGDLLFSSQYFYQENQLTQIKFYLEEVDLSGEMGLEHVGKNFDLNNKREKLFYFELPSNATIKQIEDLNQDNILLPVN